MKGVEMPEDEVKLAELEMVFEERYQDFTKEALETEAQDLLRRYKLEMNKAEVQRLTVELAKLEEEGKDAEAEEILRKIMVLKKN